MGLSNVIGGIARSRAAQTGVVLGGAAAIASFKPSLMPRPGTDQAAIAGLSGLGGFIVGATAFGMASGAGLAIGRMGAHPVVAKWAGPAALAAGGAALALAARPSDDESLVRAGVRTTGQLLVAGAAAGAVVVGGSRLTTHLAGRIPKGNIVVPALVGAAILGTGAAYLAKNVGEQNEVHNKSAGIVGTAKVLGIGLGVAGVVGGLIALERSGAGALGSRLASTLPGADRGWMIAGQLATLGGIGYVGSIGVRKYLASLEKANDRVETAYAGRPDSPHVSAGPGSDLTPEGLGRHGRRFVGEVTPAARITEVTGEPAIDPIRVYVGLDSAETVEARVQAAMDELERTGAFDREILLFASPSGTGFVNPVPITATEMMSRGDVATVAMQYGERPSVLSADRVGPGRDQNRLLLQAIHQKLYAMDPADRPKLYAFGESLGAHTMQDVFNHGGTEAIRSLGIERALWPGTPFRSEWKEEVLRDERPDTDRASIGVYNDIGEVEAARAAGTLDDVDFFMLSHDNDAVPKFGIDLLVQKPDWLGNDRPASIPKQQTYLPGVTFLQTLFDSKNATNLTPGQFDADGHDYRGDIAPFVREAYEFDHVSDDELARIEVALVEEETARAERLAAG